MDLGYAWFFIQIHVIVLQVFYPGESQPVFFVASRGHHADIGGITPGSMPPHSKYLHEEGATFKSFKLVDQGVFQEEGLYMINFGSSKWLGLPTSGAFDLFSELFFLYPRKQIFGGVYRNHPVYFSCKPNWNQTRINQYWWNLTQLQYRTWGCARRRYSRSSPREISSSVEQRISFSDSTHSSSLVCWIAENCIKRNCMSYMSW